MGDAKKASNKASPNAHQMLTKLFLMFHLRLGVRSIVSLEETGRSGHTDAPDGLSDSSIYRHPAASAGPGAQSIPDKWGGYVEISVEESH